MGSTQTHDKCPRCDYDYAMFDFYYRIQAQYVFCERCGYSYKHDQEGEEESFGVGSFRVMPVQGAGVLGSFDKLEDREQFLKDFKDGKMVDEEGKQPKELTYTFLENGEWFIYDLVNDETKPFPTLPFWAEEDKEEE